MYDYMAQIQCYAALLKLSEKFITPACIRSDNTVMYDEYINTTVLKGVRKYIHLIFCHVTLSLTVLIFIKKLYCDVSKIRKLKIVVLSVHHQHFHKSNSTSVK